MNMKMVIMKGKSGQPWFNTTHHFSKSLSDTLTPVCIYRSYHGCIDKLKRGGGARLGGRIFRKIYFFVWNPLQNVPKEPGGGWRRTPPFWALFIIDYCQGWYSLVKHGGNQLKTKRRSSLVATNMANPVCILLYIVPCSSWHIKGTVQHKAIVLGSIVL